MNRSHSGATILALSICASILACAHDGTPPPAIEARVPALEIKNTTFTQAIETTAMLGDHSFVIGMEAGRGKERPLSLLLWGTPLARCSGNCVRSTADTPWTGRW